MVFRDDSTWAVVHKLSDKETGRETGRWMVSNNSLWLGDAATTDTVYYFDSEYTGAQLQLNFPAQTVEVKDGTLRFGEYDAVRRWQEDTTLQRMARQGNAPSPLLVYTRSTKPEP